MGIDVSSLCWDNGSVRELFFPAHQGNECMQVGWVGIEIELRGLAGGTQVKDFCCAC